MKKLNEDKLPPKLPVRFSDGINTQIMTISAYNRNNIEWLPRWRDYLNGIKNYISNPVIAWDYNNKCQRFPNGTRFLRDFDYNVGYTIKTDKRTQQAYVYIFMVNLKPEEYGLKVPPTLNENKKIIYHLKESQLRSIIRESIKKVLNII